jgi:methylornithine synthase
VREYTRETRRRPRRAPSGHSEGEDVLLIPTSGNVVRDLCSRALDGAVLSEPELAQLLRAGGDDAREVFAAAREMRARSSGDAVFLYGFVYFSTYCRNECAFCFYRAGNQESPRYRKAPDEVVAICRDLAASGVVLLDLTMGEDPRVLADGCAGLLELVAAVHEGAGLPIMVSPGVVPDEVLAGLRERGADWYALYQETHTRKLYERLRVGQPFAARVAARRAARRAGLLVEDGLLTGIGDSVVDRAHSIAAMRVEGWEQIRVMTFVPQAGTPLEDVAPQGDEAELLTIAAMRLAMPQALIPASLDVDGIKGLERRLQAGANVVTSIVPPTVGLAGVSQAELDIDEGHRTVAGVLPHLERLGLRAATAAEYARWLDRAREGAPVTT